jgi:chemotaxis protein histidine kinase CheA
MQDPHAIFFTEFLRSADDLAGKLGFHLERLRAHPGSAADLDGLRRAFHSLRGNSSFVPDCPITPLAELAEAAIDAVLEDAVAIESILGPLVTVLLEIRVRLEEYRRDPPSRADGNVNHAASPPGVKGELATALAALLEAKSARQAEGRYYYAGEDVSDILAILERAESAAAARAVTGHAPAIGRPEPALVLSLDRLTRLAAIQGGTAPAELEAARADNIRSVIRFLASRVVCADH